MQLRSECLTAVLFRNTAFCTAHPLAAATTPVAAAVGATPTPATTTPSGGAATGQTVRGVVGEARVGPENWLR